MEDSELVDALRKLFVLLKPGGLLIVREFASYDETDEERDMYRIGMDVVHDVYDYIIDVDTTWINKKNDTRVYRSISEWDNIIQSNGFTVTSLDTKNNMNRTSNPIQKYTTVYKKPSNKIEIVGKRRLKLNTKRKNNPNKKRMNNTQKAANSK